MEDFGHNGHPLSKLYMLNNVSPLKLLVCVSLFQRDISLNKILLFYSCSQRAQRQTYQRCPVFTAVYGRTRQTCKPTWNCKVRWWANRDFIFSAGVIIGLTVYMTAGCYLFSSSFPPTSCGLYTIHLRFVFRSSGATKCSCVKWSVKQHTPTVMLYAHIPA